MPHPVVLLHHGITANPRSHDPWSLFVTDDQLDAQLRHLAAHGWQPIDLTTYLSGGAPPRSFLMTFDDGYASVLERAAPRLREAGVPAIVFIPAGLLGTATNVPERILTVGEALTLVQDFNFEVGAHGMDHRRMVRADDAELRRQTAGARERLRDLLGSAPRAFAYPNGESDERARKAVAEAGYEVAFATHDDVDWTARSRVALYGRDSMSIFRLKLRLARPGLGPLRSLASRVRRPPGEVVR